MLPKVGPNAANLLVKKVWKNFTFCFSIFIAVFDKQGNISGSIGSISGPISHGNQNLNDQAIAIDRYLS